MCGYVGTVGSVHEMNRGDTHLRKKLYNRQSQKVFVFLIFGNAFIIMVFTCHVMSFALLDLSFYLGYFCTLCSFYFCPLQFFFGALISLPSSFPWFHLYVL